MRFRYTPPPFFIPFIFFALLFLSVLVVTQIWGHIAVSSPPMMGPRFKEILILCHEGKAQIVQQTNTKLSVSKTAQNGQHKK